MMLTFLKNIIIGVGVCLLHLGIMMNALSWPVMSFNYVSRHHCLPVMGVQFVESVDFNQRMKFELVTERGHSNRPPVMEKEQPTQSALQHVQSITRDLLDAALI